MGKWTQVGENLVKHWSGTIYLRAKVAGKIERVSLKTKDLRIAKLKRDAQLESIRQSAATPTEEKCSTLGEAITIAEARTTLPHLKPDSLKYYRDLFAILRKTLPLSTKANQWTQMQAIQWWKDQTEKYAAQRANNLLSLVKRTAAVMVELKARPDNPTRILKRVKIKSTAPELPSTEDLRRLIESVSSQGKRASTESSQYIAFLAYSGCRHGEAKQVCWEHVGGVFLAITGGAAGTKSGEARGIPISAPLRAIIESRRYPDATGPIFHIKSPRIALNNACDRIGIARLRLHDLRHFFATWCIESGVDIPTIAGWLGHQDGGVLLMRTYGHLRLAHSLEQVKKLNGPSASSADPHPPSSGTA